MTGLALILALGIGAQWLAWRLRVPSILLLLVFGFVAGPVAHWVQPDKLFGDLLLPIVSLFVAIILFEGGMSLRIADLRHVGRVVRNLVTIGAFTTGLIVAAAAHWLLQLDWPLAALLGAVLLVTGPTVIGPLLRFVKPTGQIGTILRWEGIAIDPIGALLSVLVFEAINLESGGVQHATQVLLMGAVKTAGIGSAVGVAAGVLLIFVLARFWLPDQLHSPATLAMVAAAYVVSNKLQPESGLFTVTVMGIVVANQKRAAVHHIAEFKETLSVLLVSILFIVLGARLELANVLHALPRGLLFLAALILIARPASVIASTIGTGLPTRERLFLCAMAPRGIVAAAVSSVFAIRLREAHIAGAELLVPYTFVVIIGTVVVYGLSARLIARRLGVSAKTAHGCLIAGANPLARAVALALKDAGHEALLIDTNRAAIQKARLEGLQTYYGSVVSPDVQDELELAGFGKFLAMTPNDEVNSLAALHFARVFGRSEVYQLSVTTLPPGNESVTRRRADFAPELTGRPLFGSGHTYADLIGRLESGAVVKRTQLTSEFDAAAYARVHPEAVPLFLLAPADELIVLTGDLAVEGRPGTTIVSLTPPSPKAVAPPAEKPAAVASS